MHHNADDTGADHAIVAFVDDVNLDQRRERRFGRGPMLFEQMKLRFLYFLLLLVDVDDIEFVTMLFLLRILLF